MLEELRQRLRGLKKRPGSPTARPSWRWGHSSRSRPRRRTDARRPARDRRRRRGAYGGGDGICGEGGGAGLRSAPSARLRRAMASEPGIQKQTRSVHLDSGFGPSSRPDVTDFLSGSPRIRSRSRVARLRPRPRRYRTFSRAAHHGRGGAAARPAMGDGRSAALPRRRLRRRRDAARRARCGRRAAAVPCRHRDRRAGAHPARRAGGRRLHRRDALDRRAAPSSAAFRGARSGCARSATRWRANPESRNGFGVQLDSGLRPWAGPGMTKKPPPVSGALVRNRRGPRGQSILEWSDSDGHFTCAAHAQPVAQPPVHRPHRQVA